MGDPVTMIDLFAGIGGIRLGFEQAAADLGVDLDVVFSSEWDRFAQQTYEANFKEKPLGDITSPDVREHIPATFDILTAGFPCQPFSLAGISKKNALGRPHGFEDLTQGTLFHEVAEILRDHQPKAFLLENVKHLTRHDGGRTFEIIQDVLHDAGYAIDYKVINASLRVPQNRERVFIVGFREDLDLDAWIPELESPTSAPRVADILHEFQDDSALPKAGWARAPETLDHYTLSDKLWGYLQRYAEKHRKRGNGFGYGLVEDFDRMTRTLSARYHKDGSEILIAQEGRNPRRLTPRECARLQGFPEDFQLVCSDTQCYRQFGNSVAVPVVRAVASQLLSQVH